MKKILAILSLFLVFACGGDTSHSNSPMVAPVDNRTKKEEIIHQNTMSKIDAIKFADDIQVIAAKINEGKYTYKVGEKIGTYVESTTYFADEAQTSPKVVKLIGIGHAVNVYLINENTTVLEQNDFVYIFKDGELAFTMKDNETITGISDANKNEVTEILATAQDVIKMATTKQ